MNTQDQIALRQILYDAILAVFNEMGDDANELSFFDPDPVEQHCGVENQLEFSQSTKYHNEPFN